MAKQIQLSKTCISCGQSKPLSAFLQISGPEGTSYGNICSSCLGGANEAKQIVIPDDHTDEGTGFGLKIDSKTKVQIEKDKRGAKEKQVELDKVEHEKHEHEVDEKLERKDIKEQAEKKHRTNYLEPKKAESFFNRAATTKQTAPRTPAGETAPQRIAKEEAIKTETQHQEASIKQDNLDKGIDTTNIHADQYIAGKVKMHSEIFNRFKAWLPSSPVTQAERQMQSAKESNMNQASHENKNSVDEPQQEIKPSVSPTTKRR